MIQDIDPTAIDTSYKDMRPKADSPVLLYRDKKLLLKKDVKTGEPVPFVVQDWLDRGYELKDVSSRYLFSVHGKAYFWLDEKVADIEYVAIGRRELWRYGAAEERWAYVLGMQLAEWYDSMRYCPRCAHKLLHAPKSRELVCENCTSIYYPRLNPAVIVAICAGNYILVTQYTRKQFKHSALVAGYVELGETIESACRREAKEEVGLELLDLRYVASQPWPFSSSLLSGFVAYIDEKVEPVLCDGELREAFWVHRSEAHKWVDGTETLTHTLIDMFSKGEI